MGHLARCNAVLRADLWHLAVTMLSTHGALVLNARLKTRLCFTVNHDLAGVAGAQPMRLCYLRGVKHVDFACADRLAGLHSAHKLVNIWQ